jgi:tetratricopeptide (TPR) repeat protein
VTDQRSAGRIVVIAPPGVGKSRLLAEFSAGVAATVLRGRVRPQATAPYETVVQLMASAGPDRLGVALADAGVPASRAGVVQEEVTRLIGGVDGGSGGGGDLAVEREARFDAWIAAIDALVPAPQVWLVEDVHWAGGDLLAFLERAGTASAPSGRLVVATARPSLLDTAPAWSQVDHLELAPLPATDAAALIEALIGTALPAALVDAVVERSDGNPLFIEELIRTWVSVGTLVADRDTWRLSVQPEAVPLPPTVQAIYAAQLDDLPPDARLLARRGAVAGRRVPIGALGALEIGSTDGLERLRRRTLLAGPVQDAITGEAYVYRHALLRDAGYASLARAERRRLHVAMAVWLAAIAGSRADVVAEAVAEHYAIALDNRSALAAAELPPRATLAMEAATWFERAAEAALRLAAHEAGCRLLSRAIELTEPAATLDLGRRRRRLGDVLAASADLDAGVAELEAALACCPDDPASVAASAYALGRAYMQQIRFAEAEQLSATTLANLEGQPDALLARLHALHAWAVSAQGRIDGVLEEADTARAMARVVGDPVMDLEVLEHVAAARDEVDASTDDHWVELEERARSLGRWHQVVAAARARAMRQSVEDAAGAVAVMEEAAELARTHGLVEQAGWCDYVRCELLWVTGDWDGAVALGDAVTGLAERNGYQRLAFRTYAVLLPLAAERRDARLAVRFRAWREGSAAHFPASPSPYARLLNAAIEAWLAEAAGETPVPPADEVVESIIPMINPHFVAAVETVIRAWIAAGRDDLAGLGADKVAEFAAEDDATALMRASAALVGAWLGRADAGAAVSAARAIGAEWWVARALRAGGSTGAAVQVEARLGIPLGG